MEPNRPKKIKLKKKFIPMIISLTIFILATIIFFLFVVIKNKVEKITYTENSSTDYMVCLKKNDYFSESCLDNTKNSYVADLIDYITIDFSYFMNLSTKINQQYSYTVTAQVVATTKEDSSKIIYNQKDTLVESKKVNNSSTSVANIKEQIKINYADYNRIITNFKKEYVLALDADLIITMTVNYNGKYNEKFNEINNTKQMIVKIPLSEQMIAITTNNKKATNTNILQKKQENKIDTIILKVLLLMDCLLGGLLTYSIVKTLPYKKEYLRQLERILKEYDRAIVSTNNLPNFKNHSRIEVPTFEELLDARENLERPILYYQSPKEDKSIFCIMSDKEVYIYTLEISKDNYNEKTIKKIKS